MRNIILFIAFTGLILSTNAQNIVDSGTCGDSLTWVLTSDGVLTISGSGEMVDGNYGSWNSYLTQIKTVIIGDSVTTIGENTFIQCTNLTFVVIGNSVITIGRTAFLFCTNLTFITIPNSVTTIGYGAFGQSGLKYISIGKSVATIGDATFGNCNNLDTIICHASVPPTTYQSTFDFVPTSAMVCVPHGKEADYKASSWGVKFNNITGECNETGLLYLTDGKVSLPQIFPNPAQTHFTVTNTEYASLQLYNMLGQEVWRAYSTEVETHCNASLQQGLYVLKVVKNGVVSTHKVVVRD